MSDTQEPSIMERAMVLMEVQPFADLPVEDIALIAARMQPVALPAGTVLSSDDPESDHLLVILEGAAELSVRGRLIRRAGPGESIGLAAVVGETPAGERVTLTEATRALRLPRKDFEQAIADYPTFALALIRALVLIIRQGPAAPEDGTDR